MKVKIEYLGKYIKGAIIDADLFSQMELASLKGKEYIDVPEARLKEMERLRIAYLEREEALNDCCALNNRGIAFEKNGKTDLAVIEYEKNIAAGYPAHHAFKRLMIIYRKAKDYDNELRVIQRALEVFPYDKEYLGRLDKLREIVSKVKPTKK